MRDKPNADFLFTVILEYSGTTSATQVRACCPDDAIQKWLKEIDEREAYGLTNEQGLKIREAFDPGESAVPVRGLVNVWCTTILAGGELALLHLIATADILRR